MVKSGRWLTCDHTNVRVGVVGEVLFLKEVLNHTRLVIFEFPPLSLLERVAVLCIRPSPSNHFEIVE
jgi:hypothetical protein